VLLLSRDLKSSGSVRSVSLSPSRKVLSLTTAKAREKRCNLIPGKCRQVPCCMSLNPRYSSVASVLPDVDDSLWRMVMKYSKYRPSPLSMSSFIHHGENSSREISYNFLKREVPTRLAGLLLEFNLLPQPLQRENDVELLRDSLLQTFQELIEYPSNNPTSEDLERFEETLSGIRARHADTVARMAGSVMDMKFRMESESQSVEGIEEAVQYFLDRLYMTNISTRMLVNQHLYIFGDNVAKSGRHVGQIDPYCDVVSEVNRAHKEAARLCDLHYNRHPDLAVISNNRSPNESREAPITLAYVQSHLHHMLFEVIKNSMRATVENFPDPDTPLPPIKAFVSKTDVDITIKISDNGGGIPRSQMKNLFKYMFTTAGQVGQAHRKLVEASSLPPMAGLGYGLPLSRLYARYFQGEINISSMHGTGTDCYIYLRSMQENAPEQIPIYTAMTSKTYKDKSLEKMDDWTGNSEQVHEE